MSASADVVSPLATAAPAVVERAHGRVVFVDLLRCVAAFQMIQGHTIAALLAPEHRRGLVYEVWTGARGLTSVAFLFVAGFAFYVTTHASPRASAAAGAQLGRRLRRGVQLLVIGYVLHLPLAALLTDDAAVRGASLRAFVAVDVLQCIGVSLIILQLLSHWLRSARSFAYGSAVGALILVVLAPSATSWFDESGLTAPLLAYVSASLDSPFPLIPWAGHMLCGAACAAWVVRPSRLGLPARLLLMALGMYLFALGVEAVVGPGLEAMHVMRLCGVLIVSSVLAAVAEQVRVWPALLRTLAGGTLTLYVSHILIVYADGIGLGARIGPRLSPGMAAAMAALVLMFSVGTLLALTGLRARRLARAAASG